MDAQKFANLCQAVTHGNIRHVVNLENKKAGTVVSCQGEVLTVKIGRTTENWDYSICEAVDYD